MADIGKLFGISIGGISKFQGISIDGLSVIMGLVIPAGSPATPSAGMMAEYYSNDPYKETFGIDNDDFLIPV